MVIARRKEKWDGFVTRLEELRAELEPDQVVKEETKNRQKTSSE